MTLCHFIRNQRQNNQSMFSNICLAALANLWKFLMIRLCHLAKFHGSRLDLSRSQCLWIGITMTLREEWETRRKMNCNLVVIWSRRLRMFWDVMVKSFWRKLRRWDYDYASHTSCDWEHSSVAYSAWPLYQNQSLRNQEPWKQTYPRNRAVISLLDESHISEVEPDVIGPLLMTPTFR